MFTVLLFFRWICRRESDLPVLLLRHLDSSPQDTFSFSPGVSLCLFVIFSPLLFLTDLFSFTYIIFYFSEILLKWVYTISTQYCMISFTKCNNFDIICTDSWVVHFFLLLGSYLMYGYSTHCLSSIILFVIIWFPIVITNYIL